MRGREKEKKVKKGFLISDSITPNSASPHPTSFFKVFMIIVYPTRINLKMPKISLLRD
jgi:hypothetical protein